MFRIQKENVGKRIKTLYQIERLVKQKKSIIFLSYSQPKPIPAAVVINYSASYLFRMLRSAYEYIPTNPRTTKK